MNIVCYVLCPSGLVFRSLVQRFTGVFDKLLMNPEKVFKQFLFKFLIEVFALSISCLRKL